MTAAHLLRAEAINPVDHLGLARKVAMKFTMERPIEETDQYGDAMIGLMRAVKLFDPSRGFQFSTYAFHVIRKTIIQEWHKRNKPATPVFAVDPADLKGQRDMRRHQEAVDTDDEIATMLENVRRLPDQQRQVIELRLQGKRLREICPVLGVSRQRVNQIKINATGSLRQLMATAGAIG